MNEKRLKELGYVKNYWLSEKRITPDVICFCDPITKECVDEGFLCGYCNTFCETEDEAVKHYQDKHKEKVETVSIPEGFVLNEAYPHSWIAIGMSNDGLEVCIGRFNVNYEKEAPLLSFDDMKKTYQYKANVHYRNLMVKIQELVEYGVPNSDIYAWYMDNGNFVIRYLAVDEINV